MSPEPSIWRLQRTHSPSSCVGDAVAVGARWRERLALHGAALYVDQVLVVGAGHLILVTRRRRARLVVLQQARVALGVVHRRRPGGGLGVQAGHDHDAVVVVRGVDRLLDRVELALGEQPLVEAGEPARLALAQPELGLARADPVAALLGGYDRAPEREHRGVAANRVAVGALGPAQLALLLADCCLRGVPAARLAELAARLADLRAARDRSLADDPRVARRRRLERGEQVARLGDLAPSWRIHAGVPSGIGPVRRPLQVRRGSGAHREQKHDRQGQ